MQVIGRKAGLVSFAATISRHTVRENPNRVFVFSDTLARTGNHGIASECRREPNAVGIPTMRYPGIDEDAFFTNSEEDFVEWRAAVDPAFRLVEGARTRGVPIVFPVIGIGMGRSGLVHRAPKIYACIQEYIYNLTKAEMPVSRLPSARWSVG